MNDCYSCPQNAPAGKGYDSVGDMVFGFEKWDRVYEANKVQNIPFTLLDWKASTVQTVGMK